MVTNSANRQRQVRLFFHYQAEGNPWFICTLWVAQYRIAHATTLDELHSALPLLEWVRVHSLPSGIMAEQVNPFTSEPPSVSPLTWSHAEYVLTVRWQSVS
jgi:GH15 family glucan-1,4-alpha-glucosidase